MKVILSDQNTSFINDLSTTVYVPGGSTYRYMPFWFKETDQKGVFEMLTFEELPSDVIITINDMRKKPNDKD